jgi:hypothetical protein
VAVLQIAKKSQLFQAEYWIRIPQLKKNIIWFYTKNSKLYEFIFSLLISNKKKINKKKQKILFPIIFICII